MQPGPGAHLDLEAEVGAEVGKGLVLGCEQCLGHRGVHADGDLAAAEAREILAHLADDAEGHALAREHVAASLAIGAGLAQGLHEILAGALAGHLDQAEFGDLEDVGPGLVLAQGFGQRAVDAVSIRGGFHVDQVEDHDAADVAKAQLVGDLLDRLEVGLEHRFFEVALTDEAAGVHVDRGQRFALVDDQRGPGLEKDPALEVGLDLRLQTEVVEDRSLAFVVLKMGTRLCDEFVDEGADRAVGLRGIDRDALRVRAAEVADHAQGQLRLGVEDLRCPGVLGAPLDRLPYLCQVADIRLEIGVTHAVPGGADDEAQLLRADLVDDLAQPPALPIRADAARDADAARPGGEDEVPSWDRDLRSDARTLGADGLLRDLYHDLLAFLEDRVDLDVAATVAPAPPRAGAIAPRSLALRVDVVAGVEERGLLEADVDKGSLHPGEDARDAPQDHAAHHVAIRAAFDVELGKGGAFEQRDAGLAPLSVDDDFVVHESFRCKRKRSSAAFATGHFAGPIASRWRSSAEKASSAFPDDRSVVSSQSDHGGGTARGHRLARSR